MGDQIIIHSGRVVDVVHGQFECIHDASVDMFDRQRVLALAVGNGFGELASVCLDEVAYNDILRTHLVWQAKQAAKIEEKP